MDDRERTSAASLITYVVFTYVVAWTSWFAAWAIGVHSLPGLQTLLFYIGTFAPGLVALWFTARADGRAGVEALLRRLFLWDVALRWYVFALGYMLAIKLSVALIHRMTTGAWPRFGEEPVYLMIAATIISTLIGGQSGEEIGWRGYLLPRLATRTGLAGASVLLGVIWAAWHLPLFFIQGTTTTGQSFPLYLLQVTALSVTVAWLYAKTNGSLTLTMLLHAAVNNTKDIVPSFVAGATDVFALSTSRVAWLTVLLLWICAAYFLVRMPRLELRPVEYG